MIFDKPSAEIDLAVAKAARIKAGTLGLGSPEEQKAWRSRTPEGSECPGWIRWNPSSNMTDAWEAAEKVGLLSPQGHQGFLHGSIDDGYVVAVRSGKLYVAPTGPLAICAAIIETQTGELDEYFQRMCGVCCKTGDTPSV